MELLENVIENLTKEQRADFERIARLMIKWLNDNCHPHVTVVISPTHAELSEGVAAFRTNEYLKD